MAEKKKTRTSTAVKARYNAKAYDQLAIRVPKGKREVYKAFAESRGISLARLITELIEREMTHGTAS